jgi:uncharacterized membrane protein
MEEEKPDKETLKQWHDDPSNWKWGFIYFNKKDKRLLTPKKIEGLGWTINFANPYSIFALLLIIVAAISLSIMLKKY